MFGLVILALVLNNSVSVNLFLFRFFIFYLFIFFFVFFFLGVVFYFSFLLCFVCFRINCLFVCLYFFWDVDGFFVRYSLSAFTVGFLSNSLPNS